MRKVIVQEFVTIDNFGADASGELSFMPGASGNPGVDLGLEHYQLQFIDSVDTMLLGRNTYQLFAGFWPEATTDQELVADKLNALGKIVFSQTLGSAPWGKWEAGRVVKGMLADEIKQLKQQPGKDMVVWGSLSLVQSLIRESLVDEYIFMVCPVAIGAGKEIFPEKKVGLKLMESKAFDSGVLMLRYIPYF